jgi:hypothetical protein
LPGYGGIVGILEPVETPVTTGAQFCWEGVALGAGGDAAVLGAPACAWGAPFGCAAVEDSKAAAWHLEFLLKSLSGEEGRRFVVRINGCEERGMKRRGYEEQRTARSN